VGVAGGTREDAPTSLQMEQTQCDGANVLRISVARVAQMCENCTTQTSGKETGPRSPGARSQQDPELVAKLAGRV